MNPLIPESMIAEIIATWINNNVEIEDDDIEGITDQILATLIIYKKVV